MACNLDALFQSAILHVLPVVSGLEYLFKILLSVANLGYLFDMTILSTWEEALAHQLGWKALG